jgi:hypothetical protein
MQAIVQVNPGNQDWNKAARAITAVRAVTVPTAWPPPDAVS